jgi:hypothetical protein
MGFLLLVELPPVAYTGTVSLIPSEYKKQGPKFNQNKIHKKLLKLTPERVIR